MAYNYTETDILRNTPKSPVFTGFTIESSESMWVKPRICRRDC